MSNTGARVIVWYSCGAASACTAKLALEQFGRFRPVDIVNCDMSEDEHPDNKRFTADVEKWIGHSVRVLPKGKYKTVDEVIEGERYMAGVQGAPCTVQLKKIPRFEYQEPDDLQLYGYTIEEGKRIIKFKKANPELNLYWILAAHGMTKEDCKRMVQRAGIELPKMYQLGFPNNNCIGCVKAKSVAYWASIRHYFPEVFEKRCRQGRELGVRPLEIKRKRLFLDELPEVPLLPIITEDISCGPHCGIGVEP